MSNYPAFLSVAAPPPSAEELEIIAPVNVETMTVREAVERFISLRIEEGALKVREDHYRHIDKQLRRSFCEMLGTMPLREVRSDHIRVWLRSLKSKRGIGGDFSPVTARHYLKAVKFFFKRAHAEGWILRDPAATVINPKPEERSVNVVSAEQAFHCFKTNVNNWAVYRLALEAFGGLRASTAGKISFDAIKQDRKAIEMAASIHKTKKRVFRQGQPDNLWLWLAEAPPEAWNKDWRAYREGKQVLHLLCGLRRELNRYVTYDPEERKRYRELHNVWRHSFATYMLALEGSYPRCQYLMQHTTAATTMVYEGMATKEDAKLYFSITPEAVRTMDWHTFKKWVLKPDPDAGLSVTKAPATAAAMGFRWQTPAGNFLDYRAG